MLRQISKLAQHSAVYAASTAIQKLPGLILLPIYTNIHYIPSRSDFGDYAMIFTFIAFMHYLYTYGMDAALLRYFFLDKKDQKTVFSSTFLILLLTSMVTTLMMILFSPFLANLILKSPAYAAFIRLAGLILFFDALGNLPYLILRAEEKSIQYTLFRGLRFILEMIFNILFVVVLRTGVIGILYTSLAAAIINLLVMLPIILRYLTRRIDVELWKEMLKFGLPFLPNGIAFTTIEMVDRFIVPEILGKDTLGLYAANYKFGAILLMIVIAFRNAWQPFFLKISQQSNAKQVFARVLTYFVMTSGLMVLLATLFIRDILTWHFFGKFYFLGEAYWPGISIIPVILLSYCFFGVYVILTPGFYITKKSNYMILFTGSAALINILTNLILLPKIGIWGAALATLISYITMALTIYLVSNKVYAIPIEWPRLAKMFWLMAIFMVLYYTFDLDFWMRILLMLAALVYAGLGILNDQERRAVIVQLAKLRS